MTLQQSMPSRWGRSLHFPRKQRQRLLNRKQRRSHVWMRRLRIRNIPGKCQCACYRHISSRSRFGMCNVLFAKIRLISHSRSAKNIFPLLHTIRLIFRAAPLHQSRHPHRRVWKPRLVVIRVSRVTSPPWVISPGKCQSLHCTALLCRHVQSSLKLREMLWARVASSYSLPWLLTRNVRFSGF